MSAETLQIDDDSVWDDFVRRSPHGSPFMLSAMLRACSDRFERWGWLEDGRLRAVAPVFKDGDGRPCPPPAFMLYQGMLLEPADGNRQSDLTRKFRVTESFLAAMTERFDRLDWHQHWAFEDLRPFQWLNYHSPQAGQFSLRLLYTGIADLGEAEDFDHYLGSIRTLRRREWNKAAKTVTAIEPCHDIDALIDLHDRTYGRQGLTLGDGLTEHRHRIVQAGLDHGFGRLGRASTASGLASMIYFLFLGDTAYYLFGASDPDQRASGASTVLMLSMIKDAAAAGIRRIDFCGLNSPTRGDYKISLGGEPKPYFLLGWTGSK
ncbi:MAG: GNAT family N-acetyltransferase [Alphaproteobacteria bacterium]|nr:GNAT family N-acetyltransferase [Alphaproteobacteria bacterium]